MDIRQLKYFIAIAEEKKITAAAKRLHMAQPPLSQQLKLMEEELDLKLFERTGKHLELTEAGRRLYKYALDITKLMEEAQTEVKETGSGIRGKLTIGVNTLSDARLPGLLQAYRQTYPHVTYKIQQNESEQLCSLVRDRQLELAIVRLPIRLNEFAMLPLYTEPFVFAVPGAWGAKLSDGTVSYEDICSYPLILPSTEGLGLYHLILEAFTKRQLTPQIICECSDANILFELISSGFGAAIIPYSLASRNRTYPVAFYEIDDGPSNGSTGLIWLSHHYLSGAAQRFIELVKSLDPDKG